MSALTDHERHVLQRVRDRPCQNQDCALCVPRFRTLADALRQELPDIDDVTLARVLMAVSVKATTSVLLDGLSGLSTAKLILGTASELAATELDTGTSR